MVLTAEPITHRHRSIFPGKKRYEQLVTKLCRVKRPDLFVSLKSQHVIVFRIIVDLTEVGVIMLCTKRNAGTKGLTRNRRKRRLAPTKTFPVHIQ